ncbi:MAG: HlyD family secretion protein [Leptospirillia bacterium]
MKKQAMIAVFATVIGIGTVSVLYASYIRTHISTDDAQVTGHLDPITSRIAGPVAQVLIKDNQVVHAGDVLIEIDPRLFQSTYAKDKAALARDMAQLKVLSATIERDRAYSDLAKRESRRTLKLSQKSFATASRLDKDMSTFLMAQAQTKADLQAMKVLKETIHRDEAILAIDSLNLRYTKVRAPADGRITGKTIEMGSFLTPGQVVGYVVPFNMWIVANYKETDLHGIHRGDPVNIKVDALPGETFHGHVDSIAQSTGAVLSLLPPENATGNFTKVVQRVPVKILIDPSSDPNHRLRIGMSAVPVVLAQKTR